MPKHEPITATEDVIVPGEIEISGKSGSVATTGDIIRVKKDGVISDVSQYVFANYWQRLQTDGTWVNISSLSQDTLTITDNFCTQSPFSEIRLLQYIEERAGATRRLQVPTNSVTESFQLGTGPDAPPTYGYPSTTSVSCPTRISYVAAHECVAVGVGPDKKVAYDDGEGWKLGATIPSMNNPIGIFYGGGLWYIFDSSGLVFASANYKQPQSWSSPGVISGATKLAAPGFKSRMRVWALVNGNWEAYHQTPGSTSWSKSSVSGNSFTTSSEPVSFYAHGGSDSRVSAVGGRNAMITASSTSWGENLGLIRSIPSYERLGTGGAGNRVLFQTTQSDDIYTSDDGGANWFKTGRDGNKTVAWLGNDNILWSLGSGLKFIPWGQGGRFNSIVSNGRNFRGGCHQPAASRWIFANGGSDLHIWGG